MQIVYKEEKSFTQEQVQELFLSVRWVSGNYPEQLYRALLNSQTVFTAWGGDKLVGLVRAIDDGVLLAYMHFGTPRLSWTRYRGYNDKNGTREIQRLSIHRTHARGKQKCGFLSAIWFSGHERWRSYVDNQ